ncbi:MAG TPA: DnaJ domain-containing protein, partial [Vitreimonas sp.]|nr:DnaJ domain-containing protein [Vitreimonas sp.]
MEYRDYYRILGLPRTASQAEIKKAFRKLARQNHPDIKPGDAAAEQRFKDVNEAHAVLGDPEKRRQYDELGENWEAFNRAGATAGASAGAARGPFGGFGGFGQGGNVRYEFRTSGGENLGGFSDFFEMLFGAGRQGHGPQRRESVEGAGFEDILGQMGIDADGAGRQPRPRAPHARPRPANAEAAAELTLEEAFHGTSRLVDVGGRRLEVKI